jgi:hypothetical protein
MLSRTLAVLTAALMTANGIAMLLAPVWWYGAIPGVVLTGPFNSHFIADIGAAYLVVGGAFAAFAWRPAQMLPALAAATGFLTLHAFIHIRAAIVSPTCGHDLVRDFPGVFLPALIGLGLIAAQLTPAKETRHA